MALVGGHATAADSPASEGLITYCSGPFAYLISPDGTNKVQLAHARMALQDVALAPDGVTMAWVRGTAFISHVYVQVDAATTMAVDVIRGRNQRVGCLGFRPDSSALLYSGGGRVVLVDLPSCRTRVVARGDRGQWVAGGPQFIYETGAREEDEEIGLHLASVEGGPDELVVPYGCQAVVSADGARIAYRMPFASDDPRVYIMELASRQSREMDQSTRFDRPLAFSPDGGLLLVDRADLSGDALCFQLCVLDVATGGIARLHSGSTETYEAAFSPGGQRVCFAATVDGRRMLHTVSIDGQGLSIVAPDDGDVRSPHWRQGR